jgi:hypothetical protein
VEKPGQAHTHEKIISSNANADNLVSRARASHSYETGARKGIRLWKTSDFPLDAL